MTSTAGRERGWGDLDQSGAAVWTAAGIIIAVDLLTIGLAIAAREAPSEEVAGALVSQVPQIAIDLFLAVNLLRGKRWARTVTLVRVVLGLLVWGALYGIEQDFTSLVMQAGFYGALILLLTGTSTRNRIGGAVALLSVTFVGWIVWPAVDSFTLTDWRFIAQARIPPPRAHCRGFSTTCSEISVNLPPIQP